MILRVLLYSFVGATCFGQGEIPRSSPVYAYPQNALSMKAYKEGLLALEQKQLLLAIDGFRRAVKEKPENAEYQRSFGVALAANGDAELAAKPLEKACLLDGRLPEACFQYGRVMAQLNRHEVALAAYERAQLRGETAALFAARAVSLEVLGRLREADEAYRAALSESALRAEQSAQVQLRYAAYLGRQGHYDAALWQVEQAIRKRPLAGPAWVEKARILSSLERPAEAIPALEEALAKGERNKANLLFLAGLHSRAGNAVKAAQARDEARQLPN
jgi:tetratricopeptide (TPR) repeat protein